MSEPAAIPRNDATAPLDALRQRLQLLHVTAGEPSTRTISKRTKSEVSHTTVAQVLRVLPNLRWPQLEHVVKALSGDAKTVSEFHRLWIKTRQIGRAPHGSTPDIDTRQEKTDSDRRNEAWRWHALEPVARELAATGHYRLARALQVQIHDALTSHYTIDDPVLLRARALLAEWTGKAGNHIAARNLFTSLLAAYLRVEGPDHPQTLDTRHSLALWTGNAGDAKAARDQFAALLSDYLRVLGAEHPSTRSTQDNLAQWTERDALRVEGEQED
ncbi:hypothetical protein GCM10009555_015110 [Acrocarpospora macrocephala]|uniref:Tetratricopeptide repeat protein n=1 Tax=Acrocarpospora macrocephala TaxID=150177 RepID=A0A5M3X0M4_9ACTN|nr:tetratricopeptide repeat protein [Acrocarpospora macrocephala]GES14152.1 hypothetical protein Amac_077490 [Acrocarpospora macrocephala]